MENRTYTVIFNKYLVADNIDLVHSQHSFPQVTSAFPAGYRTSRSCSIPERRITQFFGSASSSTSPSSTIYPLYSFKVNY